MNPMDVWGKIANCTWLFLWGIWVLFMFTNKKTRERDRVGSRIWYNLPTILSYFLMFTPYLWIGVLGRQWIARIPTLEELGVALTMAGAAIAIWARLSIGRNWSAVVTVKQDHQLVRIGPYAWVRHPIYTGLITAMMGTALLNRRWAGILSVLLMTAAFLFKSRIEEQYMVRTFGPEYEEYRASSGAFLPRI